MTINVHECDCNADQVPEPLATSVSPFAFNTNPITRPLLEASNKAGKRKKMQNNRKPDLQGGFRVELLSNSSYWYNTLLDLHSFQLRNLH